MTEILELVPLDTEYLLIDFNKHSTALIPTDPKPLDLTGISRFKKMHNFQLIYNSFSYNHLFPISIDTEAMENLTKLENLTSFRISVPVRDSRKFYSSLSEIVQHLTYLNLVQLPGDIGYHDMMTDIFDYVQKKYIP
jgi:hypothetical protein